MSGKRKKGPQVASGKLGEARKELTFAAQPLGFQIGPEGPNKKWAVVTRLETLEARDKGVWVGAKIRSVNGQDTTGDGWSYDQTSDLLVQASKALPDGKRGAPAENGPLRIVFGDVFAKGDSVLGNRRGEGIWFRGRIVEGTNDKYNIRYRDGMMERQVPVYHIVKRPDPSQSDKGKRPSTRYGQNLEFEIGRKIGQGSFGQVYMGRDVLTGDQVAIKFEDQRASVPQLYHEFKIMHKCMNQGVEGIPRGLWCEDMERHRVLIMDLLGPSLEDIFNFCGRQFTLKTALMLADQMVRRLESFHGAQHIHRDIKTDNFCMGLRAGMLRVVHLIDFGLSKCFLRPNGKHIPIKNGKSLTGTPRYVSINVHKGIEPSRRDDLESTGYLFLYFLRSKLPWQGQQAPTREAKYRKIMNIKQTRLKEVCNGLPEAFYDYSMYCRKLKFEQKPDYEYLKNLFNRAFQEQNMTLDHKYDWVIKLEDKNYSQKDLQLPTLARFKSEERKHAEQIEQMMNDGELDGIDEEELERKMAEMEGITRDILGELDKEATDDHEQNLALMYSGVRRQSMRYKSTADALRGGADGASVEKQHDYDKDRARTDDGANGKKEGGQGCSCTIL